MKIDDEWMDLAEEVYAEMYAEAPPEVDVRNDATAADWLREELGQGKLAGVFRRGDMLVHTPRSASTATYRRRISALSMQVRRRSGPLRPSGSSPSSKRGIGAGETPQSKTATSAPRSRSGPCSRSRPRSQHARALASANMRPT